jgi:predicted SnoaL-like aldol condensation-catalyzing enzyme
MRILLLFILTWPVMASENKKIVEEFYREAFINGNAQKASELLDPNYIQHNPNVATGKDGFLKAFKNFDTSKYEFKIKKSISEGDLVVLHLHVKNKSTPNSRGRAVVDFFRVENGKIAEHWDVSQEVPEITIHQNTMF